MKWPRFQFSLRTLFLVTALIAIGFVSVRWWIGPHRQIIPVESDFNIYLWVHGVTPRGNIELEYFNELGKRRYVSVTYDVTDIVQNSNAFLNKQQLNEYENVFTNMNKFSTNILCPERIVRVVAEIHEVEDATGIRREQQSNPQSNYFVAYVSDQMNIYRDTYTVLFDADILVLRKSKINDVPPSIRHRVIEELDAIRRKQATAN